MVANDSEVQLLEALRGELGARDRLWALAAALDAGVVEAAGSESAEQPAVKDH